MAEFFESPRVYIQSAATIRDKICRIDALILATLDAMAAAASEEDTEEYRLNDGQTIIQVKRRSAEQMAKSLEALEKMKQYYVSDYNGHSVRLVNHEDTRLLWW